MRQWPVAQTRPGHRALADDRPVVRGGGPQPGAGLDQLQLRDARQDVVGAPQQLQHAPRRDRHVESLLLHGRARPPAGRPGAARRRPPACGPPAPRAAALRRRACSRRICPFTGPHRHARGLGQARDARTPPRWRARPRGAARRSPSSSSTASTPSGPASTPGHAGPAAQLAAAATSALASARDNRAGRHLMVAGRMDAAGDARREPRLQSPALACPRATRPPAPAHAAARACGAGPPPRRGRRATVRVPVGGTRSRCRMPPRARARRQARCARRRGSARPARSSPKSASVTGASMPAATPVAPAAGSDASSTTTRSPRRAALHAAASPIAPAPTTTASAVAAALSARLHCHLSLRRHYPDQVPRSAAHQPPSQP